MCDCCDIPSLQPAVTDTAPADVFTLGPFDTGTDVTLPDPFTDIENVVLTDPQPDVPFTMPFYDPNAPTLSDVMSEIDTINTNIIDPYPGFSADYNTVTNEVDWTPDP
jgi:hypothetical protein